MKDKTPAQAEENLNVTNRTIHNSIIKYNTIEYVKNKSILEIEMNEFLTKNNIPFQQNNREIIPPLELDFYLPDYKLAIEMNGDYWHSEIKKPKKYHYDKWKLCKEKNIQLIQISEIKWNNKKDIIKSIIKNKCNKTENKIGARKCQIRKINKQEEREFFNRNHIQEHRPSKIAYGLFYKDNLLMIMSFGKPRYNKKYEWEIIRIGTKLNWNIIGGISRLLNQFKKDYNPNNIISYSLNDYGSGNIYEKIGFEFSHISEPNYIWTNGINVYSRYQCQKHKLNEILGDKFNNSLSEKINMENNGYFRIYDSGNSVWKKVLDKGLEI